MTQWRLRTSPQFDKAARHIDRRDEELVTVAIELGHRSEIYREP